MTATPELADPARIDQIVGSLSDAVAFETTAGRSNSQYIDHMRGRFNELMMTHEVPPELYDVVQTEAYDPEGNVQLSLAIRLGPNVDGGIAFVGHSDVVAVSEDDREMWQTDPFQLVPDIDPDGKVLYRGRGTSDMLAGNEAAFSQIEKLAKAVKLLKRPLHVGWSWGEELTCMGGDDIINALEQIGARPDVVIVPEPTGDDILIAHKGAQVIDYRLTGKNAFPSAVRLIKGIHYIQDTLRIDPELQDPVFDPTYAVANAGLMRLDPATGDVLVGVQVRDTPDKATLESIWRQLEELRQTIIEEESQQHGTSSEQTADGGGDDEYGTQHSLKLTGIGGHSAWPERGVDVGRALVASVLALDETLEDYPGVSVAVTGAAIGNASNAIPRSGELHLSLSGQDAAAAWEAIQLKLATISRNMQTDAETAISNGGNGNINEIGIEIDQPETEQPLLPNAARRAAQLAIEVTMGGRAYPLPFQDPSRVKLLGRIIAGATGEQPNSKSVAYGTDAGYIEKWIRSLVPHALVVVDGTGSMLQGPHGLDEYVYRHQIERTLASYDQLTDELMKPDEEYAFAARAIE